MPTSQNQTLVEKLEIRSGMKLVILNAPPQYTKELGELPPDIDKKTNPHGSFDFIQYFALNKYELELRFEWLKQHTKPEGLLWVTWLKKSTGFATDLTESIIRDIGQRRGMTDEKVFSINDWWSAIKFVHPKGKTKDEK